MERIAKHYKKTYSALRIYKDDLERIIAIVQENCEKVTIETEEYKLSNISDLDKLREKSHMETLSTFAVSGMEYKPNTFDGTLLSLDLKRGQSRLYLSDSSNTKLYGAAMQIDSILSARHNKTLDAVTSLRSTIIWTLVCYTVVIFGLNQPWKLRPNPSPSDILWPVAIIVFAIIGFAFSWVASSFRDHYGLMIYLDASHARKRLTREQRKQLLNGSVGFALGVLSTVIGGLIVWVLTR